MVTCLVAVMQVAVVTIKYLEMPRLRTLIHSSIHSVFTIMECDYAILGVYEHGDHSLGNSMDTNGFDYVVSAIEPKLLK